MKAYWAAVVSGAILRNQSLRVLTQTDARSLGEEDGNDYQFAFFWQLYGTQLLS